MHFRRWLYTFEVSSGETLKTRASVWTSVTYKLESCDTCCSGDGSGYASQVNLRPRSASPVTFSGLQTLQVGDFDDADYSLSLMAGMLAVGQRAARSSVEILSC